MRCASWWSGRSTAATAGPRAPRAGRAEAPPRRPRRAGTARRARGDPAARDPGAAADAPAPAVDQEPAALRRDPVLAPGRRSAAAAARGRWLPGVLAALR